MVHKQRTNSQQIAQKTDGGRYLTGSCYASVLAKSRACHHATVGQEPAQKAAFMLKDLLRRKEADLEDRGRLLLKSKVCPPQELSRSRKMAKHMKQVVWWTCHIDACDGVDCLQYAIEQLQQQLQDSEQVQDDIKAEARQVRLQTASSCLLLLYLR